MPAIKEKCVNLQSAIHFLYPPQCLTCGVETSADFALCGACWRDAAFITGLVCDACGLPLPGELSDTQETPTYCDACIVAPRPWSQGRAAFLYEGTARRMVLALKYGDRQELARPMARWMVQLGLARYPANTLIAPVPLHSRRLFSRRFNQAALLASQVATILGQDYCPDLLSRVRATIRQEGMTWKERYENQRSAFRVNKQHQGLVQARSILLIDDVMTSGATLSGCAGICLAAGANEVNVLVLARVARDT